MTQLRTATDLWHEHHDYAPGPERVLRWNLGRSLEAGGRWAEAQAEFDAALALPEHPGASTRVILEYVLAAHERRDEHDEVARVHSRLEALEQH